MAISESLLPEFDHEMANTRKTLERVPEDKSDWKPHPKSMAMGGLATHLSNIPTWAVFTIEQDSLDLAPGGEPLPPAPVANSQAELLSNFDTNVTKARAAIANASDARALQALDAINKWKHYSNVAQGCSAAQLRDESFDSSPGTTRRLSETERHRRAVNLRPFG